MNCISCNGHTDVYDSRLLEGNRFRRKRKCRLCGIRFSTFEVLEGELVTPTPKPKALPKPKPVKRKRVKPKPELLPKRPPGRPRKPLNLDDDFEVEFNSISDELWEVARDLGIEGYK